MTTLYLAEKPSQAKDIANILGIKKRDDGFIELSSGDYMSWAVGHLLELAEPQEYNASWGGRWVWEHLPMLPPTWKKNVVSRVSKQFTVIKNILKKVDTVVICTDAGREGELIAREILEQCKFSGTIKRFWTSVLTPSDIKKALGKLKPGIETIGYSEAAKARQKSDWIYGLSGTRAVTLAANVSGNCFPLGRVQTPTLALVARRDLAIKNFSSKEYFELEATVTTKKDKTFKMMHAPSEEHRITDKNKAEELLLKAKGYSGPLKVEKKPETESPPLPFSLPQLQKDANRIFGFSAKNTLKVAQELYEAKAISYPRTDCQYLSESQIPEIESVLNNLKNNFEEKVNILRKLGITTRKTVFNDTKLSDHHAIVPTSEKVMLEGAALQLYTLICQRYLQLLGPDCKYTATRVTMDANGVLFKATGKAINFKGWHELKLL